MFQKFRERVDTKDTPLERKKYASAFTDGVVSVINLYRDFMTQEGPFDHNGFKHAMILTLAAVSEVAGIHDEVQGAIKAQSSGLKEERDANKE